MARPAHAAGIVAPAQIVCASYIFQNAWTGYEQPGFSSAAAACAGAGGLGAYGSNGSYFCANSNYFRAGCVAPAITCPDHSALNSGNCICADPYNADTTGKSCVPAPVACPENASRMSPDMPCTCNAGYQFDAAGTSCVRKCPVTKLDDITDEVAKKYEDGTYSSTNPDIEHLTQETQAGLACIKQKVIATNCNRTPQATSGYRPAAYQKHIYDVYYKWQQIMNNNTPECAEVKASIKEEFRKHSRFDHAPGETSNHSHLDAQGNPAGNAVDIAFVPDNALISADAIACQCNMARTVPNDAVHYQPRACPR